MIIELISLEHSRAIYKTNGQKFWLSLTPKMVREATNTPCTRVPEAKVKEALTTIAHFHAKAQPLRS